MPIAASRRAGDRSREPVASGPPRLESSKAVTPQANTTAVAARTADRCGSSPTRSAAAARPTPAPAMLPMLHQPWKRLIRCVSRRLSSAAACTFMPASQTPPPTPTPSIATASAVAECAAAMVISETIVRAKPAVTTGRPPKRLMAGPVRAIATSVPRPSMTRPALRRTTSVWV
ncbi:hypothetical protein Aph02nite_66710 [Actinoplanes philippinensis]|nr:hypothetical protein Aph02nite_66710 [Actinoplanes philippinensis]